MGSMTRFELTRLRAWAFLLSGAGAPLAAAVAGVAAWTLGSPLPVAGVVAAVAATIARWLPEVVAGPQRVRLATYHGLFPALLLATFALTTSWWGLEWIAAAVSLAGSWVTAVAVRRRLFPGVFLEEEVARRREVEQLLA